jgi:hypothetical protein
LRIVPTIITTQDKRPIQAPTPIPEGIDRPKAITGSLLCRMKKIVSPKQTTLRINSRMPIASQPCRQAQPTASSVIAMSIRMTAAMLSAFCQAFSYRRMPPPSPQYQLKNDARNSPAAPLKDTIRLAKNIFQLTSLKRSPAASASHL